MNQGEYLEERIKINNKYHMHLRALRINILAIATVLSILSFTSCAQTENNSVMKNTSINFLTYLNNCDTSSIIALHDTMFAHTNDENFRNFLVQSIQNDCKDFNMIVSKHGLPKMEKIIFKKDSTYMQGANVVIIPLLSKSDSSLNIKECNLIIVFSSDKYFKEHSKILRYSLKKYVFSQSDLNNDKIETPEWLKEMRRKVEKSEQGEE